MFERDISESEVENAVKEGEIIVSYPDDTPYPSFLCLHYDPKSPLHVVYAVDEHGTIIVITVYRPDLEGWESDFKTRKEK